MAAARVEAAGPELFALLDERDVLLHHPYESFDPVVALIAPAADDPDVLAIKQTLYRTSGDSPIVEALARAAENGKQVTVLVELKARFDEARTSSGRGASRRPACHVIYGIAGYKTHAKVAADRPPRGDRASAATCTSRPATTTSGRRACTPTSAS